MKRKFKQRGSTIPQISTKRTITYHFNSLNTKQGAIDIWRWKSRSWIEIYKKIWRSKRVTRIPTNPSW